ncbi:hypothetical protein LCGC14_2639420 [marine sediment metagenome]|uniref:Uncharacterized protein n=1 Tax=marine sediment metagenome TaxID=412755 RepID=A0A0F9AKF2_9ZZZZ
MTDRRGFLAAMAALFAGVALPEPLWEPVREAIWVPPSYPYPLSAAELDRAMKLIFSKPITDSILKDSELLAAIENDWQLTVEDCLPGPSIEHGHYWTLPVGPGWTFEVPRHVASG